MKKRLSALGIGQKTNKKYFAVKNIYHYLTFFTMTSIWFIRSILFLLYFSVVTTFTVFDHQHILSVTVPHNRWQPYVDHSSFQRCRPCNERQRYSFRSWYQSGTLTSVGSLSSLSKERSKLYMSGIGISSNYTWKEDAYEIDIMVLVPKMTRAKDISFKATSQSIDLRLRKGKQRKSLVTIPNNDDSDKRNIQEGMSSKSLSLEQTFVNGGEQEEIILLDGSRKLRGRISIDGTYWVITDPTSMIDIHKKHNKTVSIHDVNEYQQITVTVEKIIAKPKDDFDIVDYDWNGIYHTEDTNEVYERTYDKPEPFNVRQYAAELGVDIDNINMTMVDKTMFQSKLNITKSTLQTLHKAGYVSEQEIVQQLDGTEYAINEETGEPERISSMLSEKAITPTKPSKSTIPFIDTDPSWNIVPPPPAVGTTDTTTSTTSTDDKVIQLKRNFTRAAFAEDSVKVNPTTNPFRKNNTNTKIGSTTSNDDSNSNNNTDDPINMLTVVRLKEILKSQGLKTSGTKPELQDRLRNQVNTLLQQPNQGEY
jgi:hypothetical protein